MRGETLRTVEHTKTGTRNEGEEDPGWYIGGLVEVDEEANAKGCVEPSDPERRPIAASLGDYKTNDDSGRSDGEGKREDGDAGSYGRVVRCDLEVKRHIVQERPDDQALC